ncbi:hypothetical protein MIMGU_mgv1a012961mg [Erythranthe guttata]|uniref:HMG box domain-containing protein n=1 Tax=Erythranthe guttata TaxID=4155 RepID=A0A022R799_ERYGU|nr:PREDICTED: high mobility group B protein 7-like [Erythranthe guttata]EYU35548.1 hypothetical protein MIMGU_mgv1a012961mg [Erythranthe guttata]|eukprot:XP_012839618.1 PREDICTED: high mobility group B protein 7-like [Erythranthe guttata]
MARGDGASSNASRLRKRVEVDTDSSATTMALKRARDGSAFAKCEECNKDVPVALISFHNCSLDAKIKMNLESQVVEMASEAKKKPAPQKRKANQTQSTSSKKTKKAKDPNAPKRPATAFFIFMEDFRKSFKEANPDNKRGSEVAKEGGEKWKSLTEEERQVYRDRAAERKAEYEKTLELNEAEDEQDADVSPDKEDDKAEEINDLSDDETKDEIEDDDSMAKKEIKEEIEEDDE